MDGVCAIKPEYLVPMEPPPKKQKLDETNDLAPTTDQQPQNDDTEPKCTDAASAATTDEANQTKPNDWKRAKKAGGQNKSRKATIYRQPRTAQLCKAYMNGPQPERQCAYEKCKYMHDVAAYLAAKGPDIAATCHIYSTRGFCTRGVTCRFAAAHLDAELKNLTNAELYEPSRWAGEVVNSISTELQTILRKRTYNLDEAKEAIKVADKLKLAAREATEPNATVNAAAEANDVGKKSEAANGSGTSAVEGQSEETNESGTIEVEEKESEEANTTAADAPKPVGAGCDDTDRIPLRPAEKKPLDLRNKLLLSPLTTVGNLPFRRICKEFGADVTCGEMACAVPLVNGITQEWALAKRHASEDIFGVQLCSNSPALVSYATQLVRDNCAVDFVDLNLGCPIELIYGQGAGSALIRRQNILEVMVRSCSRLLGDTPFTVKTRTGVYANKSVAHELVPKLEEWGAAAVTIHGRSREQRYTKNANWEYIEECASQARQMPVFGNGDVLSYADYEQARQVAPSVSGVMIGRGALIKPWLFKEIKEQRDWDPSGPERFEMLRKFCNYGLEHWGSDTQGVENTRRFLLEWQSFLHRYVPYGLLEAPPQRINQRPDSYYGRDDLETLMASPKSSDWVRLSEMLLGPVPDGYEFVPKHRANSF